ncbi:hypothetical protein VFPFJ_03974 [Purpureocillium lilacinum]|uniref:Uncharacterized protein n=1 Tax=Purpureocillium lilacinum TaxID=33203 RepID=A0A179GWB8_PURLI|nr:hypothetical protein VFPFJ_03974 [Purpureocillium lilacinum]OAQ82194.1 hypothetical protein VFPBJ_04778 [Purpureocillium lilacinum]OAQ92234.1 hypothetical protein VFPFJ_03974 [Purpureocillium lilacinum]
MGYMVVGTLEEPCGFEAETVLGAPGGGQAASQRKREHGSANRPVVRRRTACVLMWSGAR